MCPHRADADDFEGRIDKLKPIEQHLAVRRKSGPIHFKKRDDLLLQIKLGSVAVRDQGRPIHNPWPAPNVACHFMKARLGRVSVSYVNSLIESLPEFRITPKSNYQITNRYMGVPDIQRVHPGKFGH